jgi:hypothetical protein
MSALIILDDSAILSLINDAAFASTIPCLANKKDLFKPNSTTCGTCKRKREQRLRQEMATIKSCLAGLSAEAKIALKQKLGAEKLRILYTNLAGQVVQLTF